MQEFRLHVQEFIRLMKQNLNVRTFLQKEINVFY